MPTSSDYDYTPQLPQIAPDFLREWAETRKWSKQALIWKVDWIREPLTGMKRREARVRCTACGAEMWLHYMPGGACHGGGYGPRLWIHGNTVGDYGHTKCPDCGAEVQVLHISGATSYADEYSFPITLQRIYQRGQKDRLAVICWSVWKSHTKDGDRNIVIRPYEACIVEDTQMVSLTKHGSCMYNTYETEWRQKTRFQDTMKDIYWTVCPEGIADATRGPTAENSKLELYMRDGAICFPASWLRIWQKHRNAETLMTCGAEGIISNLIGQEKTDASHSYREKYGAAIPQLKSICWKEKRPSQMLGMDRGELREAVELQKRENIGGATWRVWIEARVSGKAWTLEDASALEKLGRQDRADNLLGRPAKALHYLEVQGRRWSADKSDTGLLLDYWRMLQTVKPGAMEAEDLWPEHLKVAHDRLVQLQKEKESAALNAAFAKRAQKLSALEYHSCGLFIAPPKIAADLANEGKKLRHCVESYSKDHAAGKTAILFVRKESSPDEPYFTLEWSEKGRRVVQNRGYKNCARTPEVEAFEKEWLAWVKAGCKRNKDGTPIAPKMKKEIAA